ncbi:hypothetical protein HMPREF7215_2238 [Pyramidobacter piscolens W5455]|uniref:Uncharacterized protein n=1 Tax=Pyramidobacter piscolens W5455 TaxID=352165 RepID=A0ABM9ZTW8_9BACT|nr:hypothetical protein HMPREF7215_2238 [Pyramidobacter piscolens W5455]
MLRARFFVFAAWMWTEASRLPSTFYRAAALRFSKRTPLLTG